MSAVPKLRAPAEDGGVLAVPSLSDVPRLIADNRIRLTASCEIMGRPLGELQVQARQQVLGEAGAYLSEGGEPLPAISGDRLILAGHQPELFHPGVWVKHFALRGLAEAHGLVPVNLVVDNDTAKATVLRVPAGLGPGTDGQPHLANVPYDHWKADIPYEERQVLDENLFASLPERTAAYVADWSWRPLLEDLWHDARQQARRTALLGERLAAARRSLERRWGCHNLELPISRVCRTPAFASFAAHILTHQVRFHGLYNEIAHEYRRRHGIRSRNHPVPDLAEHDGWLELPFWGWRADRPRRHRLLARSTCQGYALRAGGEAWPDLPAGPGDAATLIAAWHTLETRGFKVRSRALTTTLFARLLLADLFIHGIGGARYDELTDELMRRFYGIEPPHFLILSATLLLPFSRYPLSTDDERRLGRNHRDVHWNPQRHLAEDAPDARAFDLANEKQKWIEQGAATAAERRRRFQRLRELTDLLHPYLLEREQGLQRKLQECRAQLAANAIMSRRDFALCLYPEDRLKALVRQFLAP